MPLTPALTDLLQQLKRKAPISEISLPRSARALEQKELEEIFNAVVEHGGIEELQLEACLPIEALKILFAGLKSAEQLTKMNLAGNDIENLGVKSLVELLLTKRGRPITHLDLHHNKITDQGIRDLAKMLSNPECALSELNIRENSFSYLGLRAIVEALALNKTLEYLALDYEEFDEEDFIGLLAAIQHHPTLKRLSTVDDTDYRDEDEFRFELSDAGIGALQIFLHSQPKLCVLDISNLIVDVRILAPVLITLRYNFIITEFNIYYHGDKELCKQVDDTIMGITGRNELLQNYFFQIRENLTNLEKLEKLRATTQPYLSSLFACKLENGLTAAQDFVITAPSEMLLRFITILKYSDPEVVTALLLPVLLEDRFLLALIEKCMLLPEIYCEVVSLISDLCSYPEFRKRFTQNKNLKELLFNVSEAIELTLYKDNCVLGYQLLTQVMFPRATIKLADWGKFLFDTATVTKLRQDGLTVGVGAIFADFTAFEITEQADEIQVLTRGECKAASPETFTQLTQILTGQASAILTKLEYKTELSRERKIQDPVSGSLYITGLLDEMQAITILKNETSRHVLAGHEVALLLAKISDVPLIQFVLQNEREQERLPKAELLRAARTNKLVAHELLNLKSEKLKLLPDERCVLQLHHDIDVAEILTNFKEKVTKHKYKSITGAELEYVAQAQPTLTIELCNNLLEGWAASTINEQILDAIFSYLSVNKDAALLVLNSPHFTTLLHAGSIIASNILFYIGLYHPQLSENYLPLLPEAALQSLVLSHEYLAVCAFRNAELWLKIHPKLGQICANFPKLGLFILRHKDIYSQLEEAQIVEIGLNNEDCADAIVENQELWSKLNIVNKLSIIGDRHQLMVKVISFNLIPYPYQQILNQTLSEFVLQQIEDAIPDGVYELCLRNPVFAHQVFIKSDFAHNFIRELSKAKLCRIACANVAIAEHFYNKKYFFDGFFNLHLVAKILITHPHWALKVLLDKEMRLQVEKVWGAKFIFNICNNELVAEKILLDFNYYFYLRNLTDERYVRVCISHPKLALRVFSFLNTTNHGFIAYLEGFTIEQRTSLKTAVPDLAKIHPDYFNPKPTVSPSNELAPKSASEQKEEKTHVLHDIEAPLPIKEVHRLSPYQNSHAINQLNVIQMQKNRTYPGGECFGFTVDFLHFMMHNEDDERATYADIIGDLYQGVVEHIDRIHFYFEHQSYYFSQADTHLPLFSSTDGFTEEKLSIMVLEIIKLLKEKNYLLITTSEHSLALSMHPKTGHIFFLDSNKRLWSMSAINQNLLAILKDQICASCFNTSDIKIDVYHIPLQKLKLAPDLEVLFTPKTKRVKYLAYGEPTIEKIVDEFKKEQTLRNTFVKKFQLAMVCFRKKTTEDLRTALELFSEALLSVPDLKPTDHLWYERLARVQMYRVTAFLILGDLRAARNEVDEGINNTLYAALSSCTSASLRALRDGIDKQLSAQPSRLPTLSLLKLDCVSDECKFDSYKESKIAVNEQCIPVAKLTV